MTIAKRKKITQWTSVLMTLIGISILPLEAVQGEDSPASRQAAVEEGLRLPVRFGATETFTLADGLKRTGVAGISVAIIRAGKLDWTAGYGVLENGKMAPVTAESLFQAASLSKPVTVFAALRMQEAGIIDFNKEIHTYLKTYSLPPGKQSQDAPVTFRNLLSHTAGISAGGYQGYAVGTNIPTDLQILKGQNPASTPAIQVVTQPDERLAYSGGGYTLAEQALQDVTSLPFDSLMQSWVMRPLKMGKATFAQPLPSALSSFAARGHNSQGVPIAGGWRIHPEQAAAGLWATSRDLAKMLIEIYNARYDKSSLLSKESALSLMTEQRDSHAYGYILSGQDQHLSLRHYGGNAGYRAMMILYPATGDGAVFLSNSDQGIDLIHHVARSVSAVYQWPDFKQTDHTRVSLTPNQLKPLVGAFNFDNGIQVRLSYNENKQALTLHFLNGDQYSLVPTGPNSFIHPDTAVTLSFKGGDIISLYGALARRVPE